MKKVEKGGKEEKEEQNEKMFEVETFGEEEESKDDLDVTLAEAVRPPEKGELEQLISSELGLAVFSTDPLQKIRHTIEAYKLLPPETKKELFTKEERIEFERLYEVCVSFLNMYEEPNPNNFMRMVSIPWSFGVNEAEFYLYWISRYWDLPFSNWRELKADLEQIQDPNERWAKYLRYLYEATGRTFMIFAKQLQTEFIVYCMPIVSNIMRTIFTSVVSSETWNETLLLMRGGTRRRETQ